MSEARFILILLLCYSVATTLATEKACKISKILENSNKTEIQRLSLVKESLGRIDKDSDLLTVDCVYLSLEQRLWNVTELLLTNYFLPRNIDVFPAFVLDRKKLFRRDRPQFDNLTSLLPLNSSSVRK